MTITYGYIHFAVVQLASCSSQLPSTLRLGLEESCHTISEDMASTLKAYMVTVMDIHKELVVYLHVMVDKEFCPLDSHCDVLPKAQSVKLALPLVLRADTVIVLWSCQCQVASRCTPGLHSFCMLRTHCKW